MTILTNFLTSIHVIAYCEEIRETNAQNIEDQIPYTGLFLFVSSIIIVLLLQKSVGSSGFQSSIEKMGNNEEIVSPNNLDKATEFGNELSALDPTVDLVKDVPIQKEFLTSLPEDVLLDYRLDNLVLGIIDDNENLFLYSIDCNWEFHLHYQTDFEQVFFLPPSNLLFIVDQQILNLEQYISDGLGLTLIEALEKDLDRKTNEVLAYLNETAALLLANNSVLCMGQIESLPV